MKILAIIIIIASSPSFQSCTTVETLNDKGKVTSRTRGPSPEVWTTISVAVAQAGVSAVKAWTDQIAQEQKWERGEK